MNKIILSFSLLVLSLTLCAQAPDTIFARCYGGSQNEANGLTGLNNLGYATLSADLGADSSLYIATYSASTDGFVTENNGDEDIWVIKLNSQGDTLWTKVLGGTLTERVGKILALPDGGCVVVGRTFSNDGDFTGAQFGGLNDAFAVRLNANGGIVWNKRFGGTQDDMLYAVALNGTGFIMVGETGSVDGDLDNSLAGYTCGWIVSVDANGTLLWSKKTNGTVQNADYIQSFWNVAKAADNSGWYAVGVTGDFADPDSDDILFTKFDNNGAVVTKTTFGSNKGDGIGGIAVQPNGNIILAGRAGNATGNQTYLGGPADAWLLSVSPAGVPIAEKLLGGTDWEIFYDVKIAADGNILAAGFTRSTNNFASTTPYGGMDFWLVKLTATFDTLYTARLGGTANDVAMAICKNASALYLVGRTDSNDGAVTGNNGNRDVWTVKYKYTETPNSIAEIEKPQLIIYPNPAQNYITINGNNSLLQSISIISLTGQQVFVGNYANDKNVMINTNFAPGIYTIAIHTNKGLYRQKLFIR